MIVLGGEPEGGSTRATVIEVGAPVSETEAESWLSQAGEPDLEAGIAVLNRMLAAYRLAAADPWLAPLPRAHALPTRLGYGVGEEVADGRWRAAREFTAAEAVARRPRRRMLAPDGRLAALLTGRDQALVCEELVLRARLDLESGRARHAALQVLIALDTAIAELSRDPARSALDERLAELRGHREGVAAAAQSALAGEPAEGEQAEVVQALERVEAALRARAGARG